MCVCLYVCFDHVPDDARAFHPDRFHIVVSYGNAQRLTKQAFVEDASQSGDFVPPSLQVCANVAGFYFISLSLADPSLSLTHTHTHTHTHSLSLSLSLFLSLPPRLCVSISFSIPHVAC